MAQIFKLNGTTAPYITKADWENAPDPAGQGLDGYLSHRRWRRHLWRAPEGMSASDFDALFALEGQKVNLTTTNYSDRNGDYATYYGADVQRVAGRHEGPLLVDVTVEFLVRV